MRNRELAAQLDGDSVRDRCRRSGRRRDARIAIFPLAAQALPASHLVAAPGGSSTRRYRPAPCGPAYMPARRSTGSTKARLAALEPELIVHSRTVRGSARCPTRSFDRAVKRLRGDPRNRLTRTLIARGRVRAGHRARRADRHERGRAALLAAVTYAGRRPPCTDPPSGQRVLVLEWSDPPMSRRTLDSGSGRTRRRHAGSSPIRAANSRVLDWDAIRRGRPGCRESSPPCGYDLAKARAAIDALPPEAEAAFRSLRAVREGRGRTRWTANA